MLTMRSLVHSVLYSFSMLSVNSKFCGSIKLAQLMPEVGAQKMNEMECQKGTTRHLVSLTIPKGEKPFSQDNQGIPSLRCKPLPASPLIPQTSPCLDILQPTPAIKALDIHGQPSYK